MMLLSLSLSLSLSLKFALFRRINLDGTDLTEEQNEDFNYTSMTLWQDQPTFQVWRAGDAFKEAHGGGNIKGILDMLISSAQTLKGKPKLLLANAYATQSLEVSESDLPKMAGGWRSVVADGKRVLDPECFMCAVDYVVEPGREAAFLQEASASISESRGAGGFRFGTVLNADAGKGADADVFTLSTVWDTKEQWEASRAGEAELGEARKTETRFFEGKLVLTTQKGA